MFAILQFNLGWWTSRLVNRLKSRGNSLVPWTTAIFGDQRGVRDLLLQMDSTALSTVELKSVVDSPNEILSKAAHRLPLNALRAVAKMPDKIDRSLKEWSRPDDRDAVDITHVIFAGQKSRLSWNQGGDHEKLDEPSERFPMFFGQRGKGKE